MRLFFWVFFYWCCLCFAPMTSVADAVQVVLHTAGAILTSLGHLPPAVLAAPGFETAVKTRLVPAKLGVFLL